jgi:hypothetical protein
MNKDQKEGKVKGKGAQRAEDRRQKTEEEIFITLIYIEVSQYIYGHASCMHTG